MSALESLRRSAEFRALRRFSAELGRDPAQIQAAGGNTSIKADGAMLVKASGAWLADAEDEDVFAAIDRRRMREALDRDAPEAGDARAFALEPEGPSGSIETSLHAALDWPIVVHTHAIDTIALAVHADAEERTARALGALDAAFVPYVRPGLPLTRALLERATPERRVFVLGNHGLVVAGESVAEARALYEEVARLTRRAPSLAARAPDPGFEAALEGSNWRVAEPPELNALAFDPGRAALARGSALYPDHVVFLGREVALGEDLDVLERAEELGLGLALIEGRGAAVRAEASPAARAMARCFGDVMARIEPGARLERLEAEETAALADWDAEKRRRAMDQARAKR